MYSLCAWIYLTIMEILLMAIVDPAASGEAWLINEKNMMEFIKLNSTSSQEEAAKACHQLSAELFVSRSFLDNLFVRQHYKGSIWLGINKDQENIWVYPNGQKLDWQFWETPEEPNSDRKYAYIPYDEYSEGSKYGMWHTTDIGTDERGELISGICLRKKTDHHQDEYHVFDSLLPILYALLVIAALSGVALALQTGIIHTWIEECKSTLTKKAQKANLANNGAGEFQEFEEESKTSEDECIHNQEKPTRTRKKRKKSTKSYGGDSDSSSSTMS